MKVPLKNIDMSCYYYFFLLNLLVILVCNLFSGYSKESWQINEWLINYQGGFVRRGLLGEAIFQLYNYTGISPYITILLLCVSAYLLLLVFFVKAFLKKNYPIFILPFVYFLGGPVINDFLVRKDVLMILVFIEVVSLSINKNVKTLALANLFLITGLLIHEEIGFFGFPILLLMYADDNPRFDRSVFLWIKSIMVSVTKLSPSLLVFCLCVYNKGSLTISNLIWNSWKPIAFPIQSKTNYKIPTAIDGLSWPLKKGLLLLVDTMKNFNGNIYAPMAWSIIIVLIYYLLTNTDKLPQKIAKQKSNKINKESISNILIFQFLCVIPLFILGQDYGRWIFLWVTSSFAIIILIPEEQLEILFPDFITNIRVYINEMLQSVFGKSEELTLFITLFIGIPWYGWSLDFYVHTTSVYIILSDVSKLTHKLSIFIQSFFFGIL